MKILSAILIICLSFSSKATPPANVAQNSVAQSFELDTLQGENFQLKDTLGQVIYLDFWASWCGPCKISFPDMIELQTEFEKEGFLIVAISVDDDIDDAIRFSQRFPVNFTILGDTEGHVAALYNVPVMPTSYLIDRSGKITHMHTGYRPGDIEQLQQKIGDLVDE